MYYTKYNSPIGKLRIESDGEFLTAIHTEKEKEFPKNECVYRENLPIFTMVVNWLDSYFAGENPSFENIPLKPSGSDFRKLVWKFLLEIPYGETTTYGAIAKKIEEVKGGRMSGQVVGGAVGANPISIIIPCHRVIGSDGNLTGYAGGINRKIALLEIEGIDTSKFSLPKSYRAVDK